ncbi:hypothetical protein KP509_24G000800 [Ceratopteris richardii]|uniref:Uncharacterized protein n=1 Tax=Ceratopteris richardii TaxID=49495 RepID=A0A8T2RTK3_CERRI|nr:hypothetical protein KP509_24G000800 [Ceratopteris richardii]
MGSSFGPNCLANMQFMVEAIRKHERLEHASQKPICNLLLRFAVQRLQYPLLASSQGLQSLSRGSWMLYGCCSRQCPRPTIPPFSLHLIPRLVLIQEGPEWNKGKIWVDGPLSNEAAGRAYAGQWNKEFAIFLISRFEEMAQHGMMFLMIPCRDVSLPPHQMLGDSCFRYLEISWKQLVQEVIQEVNQTKNMANYYFDQSDGTPPLSPSRARTIYYSNV